MAQEKTEKIEAKEGSGVGGLFVVMLIIALVIDAISAFLGLIELIIGGSIPIVSGLINFIGTAVIGTWLYFRKRKEIKENLAQKLISRLGISSGIELIPIINVFIPTWTINVLSVLNYRRLLYLAMIAGFIMLPIILIALYNVLMPEISSAAGMGHDVSYPESADEQKMINCINNYIAKYRNSPYNTVPNVGKYFVEAGKKYGIHPGYIVAISQHESTLCANTAAKGCLCYNGWGRKAGRGQPECRGYGWYAYNSWIDGIDRQTEFIRKVYYEERGLTTVEAITGVYCPASDGCDVEGYTSLMISESEKAACEPLKSSVVLGGPLIEKVITLAKSRLGTPYVRGTHGMCRYGGYNNAKCHPETYPKDSTIGHDCSQFTGWVYYWASDGKINLPSYTLEQVKFCNPVPAGEEQPGDLVFFETCSQSNVSSNHHVGLIVEKGKYIHAPHTGDVVKISDLSRRTRGYCVCRLKPEYLSQ